MKLKLLSQQKRLINSLTAIVLIFSLILYTAPPVHAAPTIEWTSHPAAEANTWQSVTWSPELGLFVAVATSGANRVMTSPDGINWTARPAPVNIHWYSVTWSPELDLFVAVSCNGGGIVCSAAAGNRVMTSPDGVNWTMRAGVAGSWREVTWSADLGLFVAVADLAGSGTNHVMTSPDGVNWTARTAPVDSDWYSVTWSPELNIFVAVGRIGSNLVMTSPDGINWTLGTSPVTTWQSVIWSSELGKFVAVATNGTDRIMTSPDGINWTAYTAPENNGWWDVIWSPDTNLFVAMSTGGTNRVITSSDGVNWTAHAAAEQTTWRAAIWSPELNLFVAVADGGTNRVMVGEVLDHDGITNGVEEAAPNGGDGNGDGRRDRFQSHVTSFIGSVNSKYATLEVDEACQNTSVEIVSESNNATNDAAYNYPAGLMNFTTACGTPGFTTTVTQYYYGVSNSNFVLRKYNPTTNAYFTVAGATLEQVTIDGQTATKVTYSVTDGGDLDTDGTANGTIVDPVGLAEQVVSVPNTGLGGVR